jgi:hypothetical protein
MWSVDFLEAEDKGLIAASSSKIALEPRNVPLIAGLPK